MKPWPRYIWVVFVAIILTTTFQAVAINTVFHADFQNSAVQANTTVTNLNAGTDIGTWTYVQPNNINIFGDASASEKALCPDSNGNGGYTVKANFTNSLLLKSNVTVTFLTLRGRYNSPGTGKAYFLIGQDDSGNANFDIRIFGNDDQSAGLSGAVYWNNGGTYDRWFGTNYSVSGDVSQMPVSSTGFVPAKMSAFRIELSAAGYVVHFDRDNDGLDEWVSNLLPYNGSPTTISHILVQGGTGSGDWFDDIVVQGVIGISQGTNGVAIIQPEDQRQLITDWAYDIKDASRISGVTPSYAQTLFVTDHMTCLRVPIYGNISTPAHPSSGTVVSSYYTGVLTAMANARAANSNLIFFASKKLDSTNSFPAWVKNANGVIPAQYAAMLADYLQFMEANGFVMDVFGVDNETEYNEGNITPQTFVSIVDYLRYLSIIRGFTMPRRLVGPETYGPDPSWVDGVITNGWGDRLDMIGAHYYPEWRPLANLQKMVAAGGSRTAWQTEVHWDALSSPNDVIDEAEQALAAVFDCTDTGLTGFVWWDYLRTGVKGGIENRLTTSMIRRRAVAMTDSDGSSTTLRKLITRAYRSETNLAVWVINNTATNYTSYEFDLTTGTIAGSVNFEQWNTTASTTGTISPIGNTTFSYALPSRTITMFTVPYQPRNQPTTITALSNPNHHIHFTITGPIGPDYTVQTSTNLTNWSTAFTTNSPTTPFNWTDPNASSLTRRFYRLLLGP